MEDDIEQICFAEKEKKRKKEKNSDETHEMGDQNKKEMESFDEKKSAAMQAFSEVIKF